LDVRLAFFLIFTLVAVADGVGAENILGAFLAGMVMKLLEPAESTENKLTSIGYGFVIPFFFIMTGVNLDLRSLFTNPKALSLIPVLVVCFILAKLPTLLIFRKSLSNKNAFAGSFLMVTTITLVLPALQVAQNLHTITTTQSDAFVLAALIACVLGPIVFNSTYKLERADMIKERVVILGTNSNSSRYTSVVKKLV
ncbi:MAG: cation:proton antiporter, partial [Limosilactobacillus pontis]